ncbi:FD protein [Spatholobus suberectus]|nr:FD protein [Spatholobus suberectus]
MEDVWEGINLASLNDPKTHMTTTTTSKGANFLDFLARPGTNFTIAADPSPSPPRPVTALSLSTRSEFHFDPLARKDLQLAQPHHNNASKIEPFGNPFQKRAHSCNSSPAVGNKRALPCGTASGDTRNTRLMKNRESAARSRARKQETIAFFFFFLFLPRFSMIIYI